MAKEQEEDSDEESGKIEWLDRALDIILTLLP